MTRDDIAKIAWADTRYHAARDIFSAAYETPRYEVAPRDALGQRFCHTAYPTKNGPIC